MYQTPTSTPPTGDPGDNGGGYWTTDVDGNPKWNPGGGGGGSPIVEVAKTGGSWLGKLFSGLGGVAGLFGGGGGGGGTSGTKAALDVYNRTGAQGAYPFHDQGGAIQNIGLSNLARLLMSGGRVDPRLLASAQAKNSRSTQQQQDAVRGGAARSGMSGSGLYAALNTATGAAGANRSANLNYQDIADSYARNQQNLGLLQSNVTQPMIDYAAIGAGQYGNRQEAANQGKAAKAAGAGGLLDLIGKFL